MIAVLGFLPPLPLPFTPVPITLQNIGVLLNGAFLGIRTAASSMILFNLLIIAGLPILGGIPGDLAKTIAVALLAVKLRKKCAQCDSRRPHTAKTICSPR